MTAGNYVRFFGVYSDTWHVKFNLTAAAATKAQTTKELDGGIIYGGARGEGLLVYHANDTAASPGDIDYIVVDYINI